MPDIFDEVEEDLRAERAKALLKRYGGLLVAAAVLAVIAAGGWQAWQWYDGKKVSAVADKFLAAMQTADTQKAPAEQAEALKQFAGVAADGREGYRTLAQLREAGLRARAGDLAAASTLWDAVAGDGNADPLLRDLASLQWAMHHVDSGDPAVVRSRLAPLAAPDSPWRPLAEEAEAMLDLRQGRTAAAKTTLTALAQDVTAPPGVRRRAEGLLARLGA